MEPSAEPAMDQFSKMVDLAIFRLRKDATDSKLAGEIEKLGFKIAAFDDTDMMVTIKHPSTSVMQQFLQVTRESDTTNTLSQERPSSPLCRKTDESTSPEDFNSMVENGMQSFPEKNENGSHDEMSYHGHDDFQNTSITIKQEDCILPEANLKKPMDLPISVEDERDRNDRNHGELWAEESLPSCSRQRYKDQREPKHDIQGLSKEKEYEKIMKRKQERNSNDLKTRISYEAGQKTSFGPSFSDEEQTKNEDFEYNSKQKEQISTCSDLRSYGISSYISQTDSQAGCPDSMSEMLYGNEERDLFDRKIQQSLEDDGVFFVRRKGKSHDAEEEVHSQSSYSSTPKRQKEAKELYVEEGNDQASAPYLLYNTDRNGQAIVTKDFPIDSRRKPSSESMDEEDAVNVEGCVGNQIVKMDKNQSRSLRNDRDLYPNLEAIGVSGNANGTSTSVSSQNTLMDDIKNESYELIELPEHVFRKVYQSFKDIMGTYSLSTSKTGEKIMSVHVKRSHDFDRLMSYVKKSESTESVSSPASDVVETHKGYESLQHKSGDSSASKDSWEKEFQGLTFEVKTGDITSLSHDVIVCPASTSLELSFGISKAVRDRAGTELKDACRSFISGQEQLSITDVLITSGGNLQAKKVFLVVGPFDTENLMKAILTCLVLADSRGFKSIAFPFVNTLTHKERGYFETYILSVMRFDSYCTRQGNSQNLKKVTFVDKNSSVVQHFIKFLERGWSHLSTLCNNSNYDEQNMQNEFMMEIATIYRICSKTTSTGFDGVFSKSMRRQGDSRPFQNEAMALDECHICVERPADVFLSCCAHRLCQICKTKLPCCPYCRTLFRVLRGNQPPGVMTVELSKLDLPGHKGDGSYIINYSFTDGFQNVDHPHPGAPYYGTHRTAYLPSVKQAEPLICRLMLAFLRHLTFTVGTSLTTLKENRVIWNGIHHKTSFKVNRPSYGYPDPAYFNRLAVELGDRGVHLNTATREERAQISGCWKCLKEKGLAHISS